MEQMGRSSPEMTPSHSDIEKGDVKHGVCSSQEIDAKVNLGKVGRRTEKLTMSRKMTPQNSDLANPPSQEEESTIIFKVPHRLREVNEKAYEPNVISIGPYHYRKPHLARMEGFKKRWFENFVEKPHLGIDQFREAIRPLLEKIRNCYEQPLHLFYKDEEKFDEEKFVDMMVYDGCFVVQLIREGHLRGFWKLGQHVSCDMRYDLLLLENQLPFFVLSTLYGMIEPNPGPEGHLYRLATSALAFFDAGPLNFNPENTSIRHLLHLVHTTLHPSLLGILEKIERSEDNFQTSGNLIPSATEMEDAGIHFFGAPIQKMRDREQGIENMFDIKFDKNTKKLKIPTLQVCDSTERIFRNYMAYEQLFAWEVPTFFVDYAIFIDKLINTSKDVELLRKSGIIDNLLGNDEAVTKMFNKLCNCIYYSPEGFYYNEIANQVNDHCGRRWNILKAKLNKDYFHTPWSPISFLAALVVLLLTILQTIFSILSYNQQRQLDY